MHELKPSDIPTGTRIEVYYQPKAGKEGGKNVKYYSIFRVNFLPPPTKKN